MTGWKPTLTAAMVGVLTLAGMAMSGPAAAATTQTPAGIRASMTPAALATVAEIEAETGAVPQMICGPDGCGSYQYFESQSVSVSVTYAGKHELFKSRWWWQRGILGCAMGGSGAAAFAIATLPVFWVSVSGMALGCLWGGMTGIFVP